MVPESVPPARVTAPTVSERAPSASVPPVLMVIAPASARWSTALAKVNVPPLIVVPPVKSLAAESVSVPAPVFVSAPAPVRLAETVPPVAVSWETAKVPPLSVPPVLIVTLLASVSALRSKVPPLTVMALVPKASAVEPLSVPAMTAVVPVKPVFVPLTESVPPAPFIVNEPAPLSVTSRFSVPEVFVAMSAPGEKVPDVCVIVPPAKMMVPAVLEKVPRERVPPLTVIPPGRASSTPKASVPLVSVVAPVKVVFARAIVSVPPTPFRLSVPAPPMSASSETAEVAVTLSAVAARTPVVPVILPDA